MTTPLSANDLRCIPTQQETAQASYRMPRQPTDRTASFPRSHPVATGPLLSCVALTGPVSVATCVPLVDRHDLTNLPVLHNDRLSIRTWGYHIAGTSRSGR